MNDALRQYATTRSPEAFRLLVQSHVDVVYSQCLRELRDPAAADDVTQQVFITLAAKAAKIPAAASLDGWLFLTTRYCCSTYRRAAARRRSAENKAASMRNETIERNANDDLSNIAEPILDDALADLSAHDRDALLLRFFQNQPLRQVGVALGISEDAAKQRVSRAVEKLRHYFARRGVTATTASITGFLACAIKPASTKAAECALQAGAISAPAAAAHAALVAKAMPLPKIAAALLVAGTVATAAIAIHAAATQNSPPPTPANTAPAPKYADVAPNNIPATQPLAQSTPLGTLQKLCSAMEADDHESIEQCLCDDGKDPATAKMGHAYVQGIATVYRIEKAWQDKFGQSMKLSDLGFDNFPGGDYQTLFRGTADAGADLEVTFQNDEARIRVPVPSEKFTGPGPDRNVADARWSGAMFVFNRIDGDWKLNTDRTFNFGVHASRMPGNKTDVMEILANVSQGLNDTLDDIASQIESGKIATKSKAVSAVETRVGKVFRDNKIDGCNFMTLPVIGGGA